MLEMARHLGPQFSGCNVGRGLWGALGLLGHATMAMIADVYGHLLPDLENDAAKMAAGELALVQ
jgi:hypothetical protein